jgi:glycosyltransferase involved in cell wall biosynthesis
MSRRRLHIAYVCADRGVPVGGRKGASAHIAELTRALRGAGADVRIVAARVQDGVEDSTLPAPTFDVGAQRAARQMRQTVFADADDESAQTAAAEAYGLLLNHHMSRALDRLHKDWRIDAVYERYSLWSHAAATFARSIEVPYLLEVNAPLPEEQKRYRALINATAASSLESYVFRTADRVLIPSSALRPYVIEHGARPGAVHVTPNAADPDLFRPSRARVPRPPGETPEFVVGFAGSLKPWHGLEYLVPAFRQLRRKSSAYRLLVVGDGPLREPLEEELRRSGLTDAATFTGAVELAEVARLLATMDAAVAPYPKLEGFYFSPIKVFEYMAAGAPVVASDIGQIGEILRHRRSALLHEPGSVRGMVTSIEELRRHPALGARMAREARAMVCRRYTWRRNAERVIRMIATVKRRPRA